MPRRAGWWSVFLIAASPALAGQPFAVRPDMAGVALQMAGVLLSMRALAGGHRAGRHVAWSYALFETLPELGYLTAARIGPFLVWSHRPSRRGAVGAAVYPVVHCRRDLTASPVMTLPSRSARCSG